MAEILKGFLMIFLRKRFNWLISWRCLSFFPE